MLDLAEWHFLETFVRKRRSIVSADVKVCFESKMSAQSAKALLRVSGAPKALQSKYLKSFSCNLDISEKTRQTFVHDFVLNSARIFREIKVVNFLCQKHHKIQKLLQLVD